MAENKNTQPAEKHIYNSADKQTSTNNVNLAVTAIGIVSANVKTTDNTNTNVGQRIYINTIVNKRLRRLQWRL